MNKKLIGFALAIAFLAMLVATVMAIGPTKAEGKNPHVVIHGFNTQMWLPSGVMNEWIEIPALLGPLTVTTKDAAKFQIKTAYVIDDPANIVMAFIMENQWLKLSQEAFAAILAFLAFDPAKAAEFPDGIYMQIVYIGWSADDLPP